MAHLCYSRCAMYYVPKIPITICMSHRPDPLWKRLYNIATLRGPKIRLHQRWEPWPDFDQCAIEIATAYINHLQRDGSKTHAGYREIAYFPQIPGDHGVSEGWFRTLNDYMFYAELTFIERFPAHPFAKELRKRYSSLMPSHIKPLLSDRTRFESWVDSGASGRGIW